MTEEEIKLRCIEMAANIFAREDIAYVETVMDLGRNLFRLVYPYLKEGRLPEDK